ncbi:hypothetical protein GF314_15020, partial [bacterium]|nr:hypothetical protein [bacterium]
MKGWTKMKGAVLMRTSLLVAFVLLTSIATATDLGHRAPVKPPAHHTPPPPEPEVIRQGGDTFDDAPLIDGAVAGLAGTTVGYTDDYDEVCPYTGSTSPDVVYRYQTSHETDVDIDLYGSTYDTKLYVYDAHFELVACNDDHYPDYVSKLEMVHFEPDTKYYIVIDGYGGDAGDYVLTVLEIPPCELDPPTGYLTLENEPPLVDGYQDAHNGGCNSPEFGHPFQDWFVGSFHGVSGWYLGQDGGQRRDTDWFEVPVSIDTPFHVHADAEQPTYLFQL